MSRGGISDRCMVSPGAPPMPAQHRPWPPQPSPWGGKYAHSPVEQLRDVGLHLWRLQRLCGQAGGRRQVAGGGESGEGEWGWGLQQ